MFWLNLHQVTFHRKLGILYRVGMVLHNRDRHLDTTHLLLEVVLMEMVLGDRFLITQSLKINLEDFKEATEGVTDVAD